MRLGYPQKDNASSYPVMEIARVRDTGIYPHMDMKVAIGRRVVALRKRKGLKQQDLSAQLGMGQPRDLWRIEAGQVMPELPRLARLADALDTTVDWLMNGGPDGPIEDPVLEDQEEVSPVSYRTPQDQAISELLNDKALRVTRDEVPVLLDLVRPMAAHDGKLTLVLRDAFVEYRRKTKGGASTAKTVEERRVSAARDESAQRQKQDEADGVVALKKPKRRGTQEPP